MRMTTGVRIAVLASTLPSFAAADHIE
jgi:hypothetical protein